jgi:hypothetical protein
MQGVVEVKCACGAVNHIDLQSLPLVLT